ncbi:MAG: hypothetical protein SGPRY_004398 [Prymnesium sp.]
MHVRGMLLLLAAAAHAALSSRAERRVRSGQVSLLQMWAGGAPSDCVRSFACVARAWAARHGYNYIFRSHTDEAASYSKFPLMLQELADHGHTGHVAYLDPDIQIVDLHISLHQLIAPCGADADLILASDLSWTHQSKACCQGTCHCWINSGLIVVRANSDWARRLLERTLSDPRCKPFREHARQWEQDCLQILLSTEGHMPSMEALRQAHKPASLLASSTPGVLGPTGKLCILPYPRVTPAPWQVAGAPRAEKNAHRHTEAEAAGSLVLNAMRSRGGSSNTSRPFALQPVSCGVDKKLQERCDKKQICAQLMDTFRVLHQLPAVAACLRPSLPESSLTPSARHLQMSETPAAGDLRARKPRVTWRSERDSDSSAWPSTSSTARVGKISGHHKDRTWSVSSLRAGCHNLLYVHWDSEEPLHITWPYCREQSFFCSHEFVNRLLNHPCRTHTLSSGTPVVVANALHRALPQMRAPYEESLRVLERLPQAIKNHSHVYLLEAGEHWAYQGYEHSRPASAIYFTQEALFARQQSALNRYTEPSLPGVHDACYMYVASNVVGMPYASPGHNKAYEAASFDVDSRRPHKVFYSAGLHGRAVELRKHLYNVCRDQSDWVCPPSDAMESHSSYLRRLLHTDFCLCPTGDAPGRVTMWDALRHGCVPVIFSSCAEASVLYSHEHFLPAPETPTFGVHSWAVLVNQTLVMQSETHLAEVLADIDLSLLRSLRRNIQTLASRISYSPNETTADAMGFMIEHMLARRGGIPLATMVPAVQPLYAPEFLTLTEGMQREL